MRVVVVADAIKLSTVSSSCGAVLEAKIMPLWCVKTTVGSIIHSGGKSTWKTRSEHVSFTQP